MKKQLLLLSIFTINVLVAQVPSYVPTNGLVGYWPFNGNANDESGNGNNGTVSGATLVTDRFGNNNKSYLFNGIDNYIEVISNSQLSVTSEYTISAWFNANLWYNTSTNDRSIVSKIQSSGWYGGYEIMIGGNSGSISHTGNIAGTNFNISSNGYLTNNWYLSTITFDGNTLKLYINNLLVSTLNRVGILQSSNQSLFFGRRSGCCQWFSGKLDDIGIWNRALTQAEISGLYASLGTSQSEAVSQIAIYPNPAKDQITIDCGNILSVSGWSYTIVNILGQEVSNGVMNSQQNVVSLNTLNGTGVYLVKIFDAESNLISTKKIIKE